MIARVFDGKTEGLTPDDVLDNVTLYWLTNTAISSARLYWDTAQVRQRAASSTSGASRSRSPSAPSPTRSTRRRRAGRSRPIPSSSTTTSFRQGGTLRRLGAAGAVHSGAAHHSDRCGSRSEAARAVRAPPSTHMAPYRRTELSPADGSQTPDRWVDTVSRHAPKAHASCLLSSLLRAVE